MEETPPQTAVRSVLRFKIRGSPFPAVADRCFIGFFRNLKKTLKIGHCERKRDKYTIIAVKVA